MRRILGWINNIEGGFMLIQSLSSKMSLFITVLALILSVFNLILSYISNKSLGFPIVVLCFMIIAVCVNAAFYRELRKKDIKK
jgi:drug/metabolite transporter superfamily protein YnfA